jgi:hypothetical protein
MNDNRGGGLGDFVVDVAGMFARNRQIKQQKQFQKEQRAYQKQADRERQQDRREAKRDRARQLRQQRNTPDRKSLRRALAGAGVLTVCLWLSRVVWGNFAGVSWLPLAVWGFVTIAGLWALLVGLREARFLVPPNWMAAFWAACGMVGIGALFLKMVPADASAAYLVRGVYATAFAVVAVWFWIVSGLGLASARRTINRRLNARNVPLQAARPRRRFFFW